MAIQVSNIPDCLKALPQWVLWKTGERREGDKPTKLPYQPSGSLAKANDPETWSAFDEVCKHIAKYDGVGFEFDKSDPYCGIDLDGCRDVDSGKVQEWAREIILGFNSYAEVSPSGTGVKIFCRAKWGLGRKIAVAGAAKVCDKEPGIEVYDHGRYFAVTGIKLRGMPDEPTECQDAITWLRQMYFAGVQRSKDDDFRGEASVLDRARKYVAKLPGAVSGSHGHNATFHAACVLVLGFSLGEDDAFALMQEYNQRCEPAWLEKDLLRKVREANKQTGERGYLRNAAPERWPTIAIPKYESKPSTEKETGPRETTLADAAANYVEAIRAGKSGLVELGVGELDYALGGGVARGEMVIIAARPSHGKSAVALQCLHHWTSEGMPCAIVSEEMSALALGKRTLQFLTPIPEEHWLDESDRLDAEVSAYLDSHAKCVVLEGCGSAEAAAKAIERCVKDHGIQCAAVDYAQLLRSEGKSRYEQITNTSITLRQLASSLKIVLLVLCQLSRSIESRTEFIPIMADLKDSGQLEQDADVIVFLCWPHRIDPVKHEQSKFQFFIAKNRNRAVNQSMVACRFLPTRQMVLDSLPEIPDGFRQEKRKVFSETFEWPDPLPP